MAKDLVIMNDPYICALTAFTTESFKDKCIENGMDDYLPKPVETKEIRKILK